MRRVSGRSWGPAVHDSGHQGHPAFGVTPYGFLGMSYLVVDGDGCLG